VLARLQDEARALDAPVAIAAAGCTGLCDRNVQVTLLRPERPEVTWANVRPDDATGLLDIALGLHPPGAFANGWSWSAGGSDGLPGIDAIPELAGQTRVLLGDTGRVEPIDCDAALARGRYRGLGAALMSTPLEVIETIDRSGLRGRGGAYFPVATKWRGCAEAEDSIRYVVVNAEEGEPGVFKDRHLLEGDSHLALEGMLIAAYATGAERVIVFLNGDAHVSASRLAAAIESARSCGLIGPRILGTDFACEIEIRLGAGGYVLGEESTILEAIEGHRPMPRVRPPFPVHRGLWGHPTTINNVETLAAAAIVMTDGAEAFRQHGTEEFPGTKFVCLSGDVAHPGVVEIEIGAPMRQVIEGIGGGVQDGRPLQAVLTGGPSGVLVPPASLDLPLEPRRADILLGSGNLIVIDDRHDLLDVVTRLAAFNAHESCGKCTPCREGTRRMESILIRAGRGESRETDRNELLALCDIAEHASICGLGQMAPNPVRSGLLHFDLRGLEVRGGAP
jgi:NADH:ubiquinone oxidoreductase subunit F (NADH-binding)